jgi:hypothetical protein
VQVIPHITDEIKLFIKKGAGDAEIAIVEIGGTVGDIESLPFLEAIRQIGLELGRNNVCYVHLTLVPYIASTGEIKTKPTQHSVKELREIGVSADVVLCRTLRPLPEDERRKIALFCNVQKEAVISAWDVDSIYKIPMMLHDQMLDEIVCHKLGVLAHAADLTAWRKIVDSMEHPQHEVDVAFVGKYVDLQDSYKSLNEALKHAGHPHGQPREHPLLRLRGSRESGRPREPGKDGRDPGAGRFRQAGHRRQDAGDPLRARKRNSVSRDLPRHAARDDRVRAQRMRARRRKQHRIRPGYAAPGGRAGHRVARPHRTDRSAAMRVPTSAARCGSARRNARSSPARSRIRSTARK